MAFDILVIDIPGWGPWSPPIFDGGGTYYQIEIEEAADVGRLKRYKASISNPIPTVAGDLPFLPPGWDPSRPVSSWPRPTYAAWLTNYPNMTGEFYDFDSGTPLLLDGTNYDWGFASSVYITFDPGEVDVPPETYSYTLESLATVYRDGVVLVIDGVSYDIPIYFQDSISIDYSTYPSTAMFDPHVKVNYETTRDGTSAIWREIPPTFNPVISSDLLLEFGTVIGGYSIFQYDDGTEDISTDVFGHSDNSVSYTVTNSTSTVTHVVSNLQVSYNGNTYTYTRERSMDLNFVDSIPSATFLTYPSSAWNGTNWVDVANNPSLSPGASAYGNGHTEVFNLSSLPANTAGDVTYRWDVGPYRFTALNNSTTAYSASSPDPQSTTITLPVSLGIFTTGLPISMPEYHYRDSDGAYVQYDNFNQTTSANSDKLFQHLRMVPWDFATTAQVTITSIDPSVVVFPFYNGFTASVSADINADQLPIEVNDISYDWSLSNSDYWTLFYYNTGTVTYSLSVGNQSVPGQINPNQLTNLSLTVTATITGTVIPGGGYWPPVQESVTDTDIVSAFEFVSRVYLTDRYNATGENVVYQNASLVTPLLSATFWDDGISSVKLEGYESFITQYSVPATYDLAVSSVLTDGGDSIVVLENYSDTAVVIPKFEEYNDSIIRFSGTTETELPITLDHCKVPPNEWCEADNINRSLERLYNNFRYVKDVSQIYDAPPTELYGWYGNHNQVGQYWHVNIDNLDTDYNTLSGSIAGKLTDVNDVITDDKDNIYIINDTTVSVLSADWQATTRYNSTGYNSAVAIALDSTGRLHILNKNTNQIIVLNELTNISPFTLRKSWGGPGGAGSKDKYNNPNDIYINDGYIWVVDSGNSCVKKYTENGAWQQTIQNSYFSASTPISITSDIDGDMHVLLEDNNIVKMKSNGNVIKVYTYPTTLHDTSPKKIRAGADEGFLYICLPQNIVKVNKEGIFAAAFGTDIGGTINYQSIYQDEHRNIFLANGTSIVKYVDLIDSKSLNLESTGSSEWTIDDIRIDRDEFNENWVYNRCFARIWDNLELFRRSLIGKAGTSTTQDGINSLVVVPFGMNEYVNLPYDKSQIYIGVNEIMTADVINRCITQLYECQQTLVELVS